VASIVEPPLGLGAAVLRKKARNRDGTSIWAPPAILIFALKTGYLPENPLKTGKFLKKV
jgi:hypothetical protein